MPEITPRAPAIAQSAPLIESSPNMIKTELVAIAANAISMNARIAGFRLVSRAGARRLQKTPKQDSHCSRSAGPFRHSVVRSEQEAEGKALEEINSCGHHSGSAQAEHKNAHNLEPCAAALPAENGERHSWQHDLAQVSNGGHDNADEFHGGVQRDKPGADPKKRAMNTA